MKGSHVLYKTGLLGILCQIIKIECSGHSNMKYFRFWSHWTYNFTATSERLNDTSAWLNRKKQIFE